MCGSHVLSCGLALTVEWHDPLGDLALEERKPIRTNEKFVLMGFRFNGNLF